MLRGQCFRKMLRLNMLALSEGTQNGRRTASAEWARLGGTGGQAGLRDTNGAPPRLLSTGDMPASGGSGRPEPATQP